MKKTIRKESAAIIDSLRIKKQRIEEDIPVEPQCSNNDPEVPVEPQCGNNVPGRTEFEEPFENYDIFSEPSSDFEDEHYFENVDFKNADYIKTNFGSLLAEWAVTLNITNTAVNMLLRILRPLVPNLPVDARTLKKTPRERTCVKVDGGDYVHYGIKDSLTDFCETTIVENNEIDINVHIDGVQLFKSSGTQAWPILINVHPFPNVLVSGVFVGPRKPDDVNEYLKEFVSEMQLLLQDGFIFKSKHFKVNIRSFICDAPARAYVLGTKYHSEFFSCRKCQEKGERLENRIIYKITDNLVRTDEQFRNRLKASHHNILQPLRIENLPINFVNQFALDYMHIVCLGVMKTLLKSWIKKEEENIRYLKAL